MGVVIISWRTRWSYLRRSFVSGGLRKDVCEKVFPTDVFAVRQDNLYLARPPMRRLTV